MKTILVIVSFCILFTQVLINAQSGTLDHTFSNDGVVYQSLYSGLTSGGNNVLIQADGKILSTGGTRLSEDKRGGLLLRILPNGDEDLSFDTAGKVVLTVPGYNTYAINTIQQPDGKLVTLVGEDENDERIIALFRHHLDGTPDADFGNDDGYVLVNLGYVEQAPRYFVRQPDGRLIICGYARNSNDAYAKVFIARCMPDGALDPGFNGTGFAVFPVGSEQSKAESVCVQPDGKIIVAGEAYISGVRKMMIARYLPEGIPDSSFDGDGIVILDHGNNITKAYRVLLQPDGKILATGYIQFNSTNVDFLSVRLNIDGSPDAGFGNTGLVITTVTPDADRSNAMVLQPDGKIVLGGYAHSNSSTGSNSVLVRLNSNGTLDDTFGENGIAETEGIPSDNWLYGLTMQPDGKIVGVGQYHIADYNKILIARFISGLTVSTAEYANPGISFSVYPNPVTTAIAISYELDTNEDISIRLIDNNGITVEKFLENEARNSGFHIENVNLLSPLPPGIYAIQVGTRKGGIAKPIFID